MDKESRHKWLPRVGQRFWFIEDDHDDFETFEVDSTNRYIHDDMTSGIWDRNIFRTKKEAQDAVKVIRAIVSNKK